MEREYVFFGVFLDFVSFSLPLCVLFCVFLVGVLCDSFAGEGFFSGCFACFLGNKWHVL